MAEIRLDPHAHLVSMGKSVAQKRRVYDLRRQELRAAEEAEREARSELANAESGMRAATEMMIDHVAGEIDG